MYEWIPAELHCHTYHSDGRHNLLDIATAAKELGIRAVALTDHNTVSAHSEIEDVYEKTGVFIIKGLEHTTYYGHALSLGISKYIDWRVVGRHNFRMLADETHKQGGVIGIAHPFRLGTPICTGCHFDYSADEDVIDYIEVWSGLFPPVSSYENEPAYAMWTDILNKGRRVAATSGRDWHSGGADSGLPVCRTFLGLTVQPNLNNINLLVADAIKKSRISVSTAHCVVVNKTEKDSEIHVSLESLGLDAYWSKYNPSDLRVVIDSDKGIVHDEPLNGKLSAVCNTGTDVKWVRVQLYGVINGTSTIIGFANPVYS